MHSQTQKTVQETLIIFHQAVLGKGKKKQMMLQAQNLFKEKKNMKEVKEGNVAYVLDQFASYLQVEGVEMQSFYKGGS